MHCNNDIYTGVWVFAEQRERCLENVTLELLGKAREFADKKNEELISILIGEDMEGSAKELIYYGADKVLLVDSPQMTNYNTINYAKTVSSLVKEYKPSILLLGATTQGRDLAPRVMAQLDTGLTADCLDLEINAEGLLVQTKPSYGGNIMCKIVCPEKRPQMATVRPKVFSIPKRDETRQGEIKKVEAVIGDNELVRIVKRIKTEASGPKIEEADIIVAGGRGLENQENLKLIEELARVLGGAIGVTRPLVDEGWVTAAYQIGQSGKTVKPKLIITCGISGAVQFSVGMQTADCIIAINKDTDAPIFSIANFGIVGEVEEVLPVLIKKFKELM